MSEESAARLRAYGAESGPCSCGEARGHTGWLLCVFPAARDLPAVVPVDLAEARGQASDDDDRDGMVCT